jgi:hypothetical protein
MKIHNWTNVSLEENWSWESETHVSVGIRYDITRDRRDNNFIV